MSPLGPPEPKAQSRTLLILLPLGLLALNAAATQYIAARFAYHPALGAPLVGHFYLPWEWLVWQQKYATLAPQLFRTTAAALAAALGLSMMALLAMNGRSAKRHEGIHGTAHWASRPEIEATGLLPAKGRKAQGVYAGGWRDKHKTLHYLRHNGPEHVAAIAPTRSGKGVGLVVPTLLSWPYSVVVNDQKAELWNLTAAWRKAEAKNLVMKFDPGAASGSVSFNPLEEIRLARSTKWGTCKISSPSSSTPTARASPTIGPKRPTPS